MQHLHLIELVAFFSLVAVASVVWLDYRMSEEPIHIGEIDFYEQDFESMKSLMDKIKAARWVDFLEKHSEELEFNLRKIGKFPLADEIAVQASRLKSFRILVKSLAAANQISDNEKKLAEGVLNQFKAKQIEALPLV